LTSVCLKIEPMIIEDSPGTNIGSVNSAFSWWRQFGKCPVDRRK
jgi:hypothetical protein